MTKNNLKVKRLISSEIDKSIMSKIKIKDSSGFIEDIRVNDIVEPTIIKVSDSDAWRFYKGNDWIYATVNRIVKDCTKVIMKVVVKDKSKPKSDRTKRRIDELNNFFENPNNNKESFKEIREKTIRNLLIYGRATLEKVLSINIGTKGKIQEIYAQNPKRIKIISDKHGNLPLNNAYIQEDPNGGNSKYWDIDEMIHIVLEPDTESVYGTKIIDAICNTIASDILRATHNSRYFVNGAKADGVLSLKEMSKRELTKFRDQWIKTFRGASNAHKTAFVNVPIEYINMALTNKDMEFTEYGKELRAKIFAAYGMQPFIMGIVDETTGKLNSTQQVENYKDGAIKPILSKESYYYSKEIIEMGFGYTDLMIEFSGVDLADIQTQSEIDIKEIETGLTVINEVRERRGQNPVPWGNTPITLAPGGGQVDPKTGKIIPPSQQSSKPTPKKSLIDIYSENVKRKLEVLIKNIDNIDIPNINNLKNCTKEWNLYINSKIYKLYYHTIPVELKETELNNILDIILDFSNICEKGKDPRYLYFQACSAKIKFIIFDLIRQKTFDKIFVMIDRIFYEDKCSELMEIF